VLVQLISYSVAALFFFTFVAAQELPRGISFEQAADRVFAYSPALQINAAQLEQVQGEKMQSSAYPNPAFTYSVENVLGSGHWRGFHSAESRYVYTQPFILGSKRGELISLADYQLFAAQAKYANAEVEILNQLRKAFISVAATQELLKLAQKQCEMSAILKHK
jgi:outer membrane protein, heavy metal efflux system